MGAEPSGVAQSIRTVGLGQIISVLIFGTGVFSTALVSKGFDIPTAQGSLNYVLLFIFGAGSLRKNARSSGCSLPLTHAFLWALTDVEANFLVVWAYQYTSITSVMLLDCFTIPCSMVLSYMFLHAQYSRWHVIACHICILGLVLTVFSDLVASEGAHAPSPVKGDLLVLCGAMLYGMSNVLQEKMLKNGTPPREALGLLGFCGSCISVVQAFVVERHKLANCTWSPDLIFWFLGYQMCMFGLYTLTSVFLKKADAALFNLSLLTSDIFSIVYTRFSQHRNVSWLYGVALCVTMSGVTLYFKQPTPTSHHLHGDTQLLDDRLLQPPMGDAPSQHLSFSHKSNAINGSPSCGLPGVSRAALESNGCA
eukprot:gnl/MRDRNA2_/MRDRNA2_138315_c0_seq1.p1 gnl/MRDRNA2_/MRDRNA2_138315_c0~~gnl/MRDRNA2_/MRDRNA2_138315_c0_seq1.p1  ORF type:complete len:393 (-),score=28.01 gnl/MRDRNA2_/MRDRNA2_138315_c0_seq1:219-1316(-)